MKFHAYKLTINKLYVSETCETFFLSFFRFCVNLEDLQHIKAFWKNDLTFASKRQDVSSQTLWHFFISPSRIIELSLLSFHYPYRCGKEVPKAKDHWIHKHASATIGDNHGFARTCCRRTSSLARLVRDGYVR